MTDEELMTLYGIEDDAEAFNELYRKHSAKVYGYLMNKNFNKTNVDEIFQNVFLKLHSSRAQYDSKYPFMAWLFTIVRSVCIDYFRKLKSEDLKIQNFERSLIEFEEGIEENKEISNLNLDPAQKVLLEKRYLEEKSFKEIAQELQISEASVRQRISRVIRSLRGKYV